MNYYPHHIGDYARDTAHLSLLEDGAYRRMLDLCYASERPLPLDRPRLYRLLRVKSLQEKCAVDVVLGEFFIEGEDGWHQRRVEEELVKAQEEGQESRARKENEAERQRRHRERRRKLFEQIRALGEVPKWDTTTEQLEAILSRLQERDSNAPVTVTGVDLQRLTNNQEPIANNQKPKIEGSQRSRGSRLPADWQPSEILKAWTAKERPDLDLAAMVAKFGDYWRGVPGSRGIKLDWDATFRNFVRSENAGKGQKPIDYDALAKRIEEEDRKRAGV